MIPLFPKHEDFFVLFCRQSNLVREACSMLNDMVTKFDDLEGRARRLKEVEHNADLVAHEIFERLNRTFITPLDREDIHDLASGLDDVIDAVEAIASRLVLFKVTSSTSEARQLTAILEQCGGQIDQAVDHLRDMKNLMGFTIEINRLENEADTVSRQAVADLFSGRHELLDVLRWKEIYGRLESAADNCEDVANAIESIVLKSR